MVAIPTAADSIKSLTALCWAGLVAESRARGIEAFPGLESGAILPNTRSRIAEQMIARECDAVLMIDSDMTFPTTALVQLMGHGPFDVIGATYVQRQADSYVHGFELPGGEGAQVLRRIDTSVGPDLREVRSLPTGFLLIARHVLEAMDRPLFRFPFNEGAAHSIGEDYDFCRRARERGFRIMCDVNLSRQLGHIGSQIFTAPGPVAIESAA